jgi:phosphotransferase system IIB component
MTLPFFGRFVLPSSTFQRVRVSLDDHASVAGNQAFTVDGVIVVVQVGSGYVVTSFVQFTDQFVFEAVRV